MQAIRQSKRKTYRKNVIKVYASLFTFCILLSLFAIISLSTASAFADTNVAYKVQIEPTLNISVSSTNVSLNLNPLNQAFDTEDLLVSVGTNSPNGYKLYVSANSTNLTNSDYAGQSFYINTLASSATSANFPDNYWGYRISSGNTGDSGITDPTGTNFYPFVSGAMVSSSSTATNDTSSTLTFASKINFQKPSGVYSLDLNFKALPIVTTYDIQNLNGSVCTSEPSLVTDSRDGQMYTIARLADGKCWMLDNLRLDLTSERVQSILSHTNTNASDEAINYLINGGGTGQWARSGVSSAWTSSAQNSYTIPYAVGSGEKNGGGTWTKDDIASVKYGDSGSGKIGIYYNYCAASAGSYCYDYDTGTGSTQYDICPASWRMPTGGENGEYQSLCDVYKGSECSTPDYTDQALTMRDALNIPLSGSFHDGAAYNQNVFADFWSSNVRSNHRGGFTLGVAENRVRPQGYDLRTNGFTIRCLLQES